MKKILIILSFLLVLTACDNIEEKENAEELKQGYYQCLKDYGDSAACHFEIYGN